VWPGDCRGFAPGKSSGWLGWVRGMGARAWVRWAQGWVLGAEHFGQPGPNCVEELSDGRSTALRFSLLWRNISAEGSALALCSGARTLPVSWVCNLSGTVWLQLGKSGFPWWFLLPE